MDLPRVRPVLDKIADRGTIMIHRAVSATDARPIQSCL